MKTTAPNETLFNQALAIIHSNHLTRSEINSLFETTTPALDSPNLEIATRELAELLLGANLTIQEAADLFKALSIHFSANI